MDFFYHCTSKNDSEETQKFEFHELFHPGFFSPFLVDRTPDDIFTFPARSCSLLTEEPILSHFARSGNLREALIMYTNLLQDSEEMTSECSGNIISPRYLLYRTGNNDFSYFSDPSDLRATQIAAKHATELTYQPDYTYEYDGYFAYVQKHRTISENSEENEGYWRYWSDLQNKLVRQEEYTHSCTESVHDLDFYSLSPNDSFDDTSLSSLSEDTESTTSTRSHFTCSSSSSSSTDSNDDVLDHLQELAGRVGRNPFPRLTSEELETARNLSPSSLM